MLCIILRARTKLLKRDIQLIADEHCDHSFTITKTKLTLVTGTGTGKLKLKVNLPVTRYSRRALKTKLILSYIILYIYIYIIYIMYNIYYYGVLVDLPKPTRCEGGTLACSRGYPVPGM
jgi:hypothetical protein